MKISEAMRIGTKKRPQTHFGFFGLEDGQLCSCAIGAAIEGATGKAEFENFNPYFNGINIMYEQMHNPILDGRYSIYSVVTFLNDIEKWSRQGIADCLESQGY